MDSFKIIDGKKFKKGYTTGSCAAAASYGAVLSLCEKKDEFIKKIEIDLPKGGTLSIPVNYFKYENDEGICSIIKDAGDDPDVTNGIEIVAKAKYINDGGISIKAGEGIGTVTKKGLQVMVGQPAINPVPLKMIFNEIKKVVPKNKGIEITICAINGEEIAKKTFNPRLGIVGGISILGTSGIVEPMSEDAYKTSLALELDVLKAEGIDYAVFVPGNFGFDFAKSNYNIKDKLIIKTSNFIGFMLSMAKEKGFKKILMIGHIGKLVKVSGGIFNTHSHIADAKNEILTANASICGAKTDVLKELININSTEEGVEIIEKYKLNEIYDIIASKVSKKCMEKVGFEIEIGTVLFSLNKGLLSTDENAKKMLGEKCFYEQN